MGSSAMDGWSWTWIWMDGCAHISAKRYLLSMLYEYMERNKLGPLSPIRKSLPLPSSTETPALHVRGFGANLSTLQMRITHASRGGLVRTKTFPRSFITSDLPADMHVLAAQESRTASIDIIRISVSQIHFFFIFVQHKGKVNSFIRFAKTIMRSAGS